MCFRPPCAKSIVFAMENWYPVGRYFGQTYLAPVKVCTVPLSGIENGFPPPCAQFGLFFAMDCNGCHRPRSCVWYAERIFRFQQRLLSYVMRCILSLVVSKRLSLVSNPTKSVALFVPQTRVTWVHEQICNK